MSYPHTRIHARTHANYSRDIRVEYRQAERTVVTATRAEISREGKRGRIAISRARASIFSFYGYRRGARYREITDN